MGRARAPRTCGWLAAVLAIACALPAYADEKPVPPNAVATAKDRARAFARAGHAAWRAGDHRQAIADFEQAEALVHAPTHLLYLAKSHAALGELLAAADLYRRIGEEPAVPGEPDAFVRARAEARLGAADVERRLPRMRVRGALLRVQVDGVAIAEPGEPFGLDPGEHRIVGTTAAGALLERTVVLREGQLYEIDLYEQSPAAVEPVEAGVSWPGVIGLAAGGAALVAGSVTGGLSIAKVSELDDRCPDRICRSEDQPLADEAAALGTASTWCFVAGGALVAAGTVAVAVGFGASEERAAQAPLRLTVGGAGLGLAGAF